MAHNGPTLPTDLSSNRDVATMKIDQDRMRGVLARVLGAQNWEDITVSTGIITPSGESAYIRVTGEGGIGSFDELTGIDPINFQPGSVIILVHASATRDLDVVGAAGAADQKINLLGASTELSWTSSGCGVMLVSSTIGWTEVHRWWPTPALGRDDLELGTVAVLDDGQVDALTLQGNQPSAFLPVGGKAVDSELLDGLDSTAFPRLPVVTEQEFEGPVTHHSVTSVRGVSASSPALQWLIGALGLGVRRALHFFDDANKFLVMRTYDDDGSTIHSEVRLPAEGSGDVIEYRREGVFGSVWQRILTHLNVELTDVPRYQSAMVYQSTGEDVSGDSPKQGITGLLNLAYPAPDDGVDWVRVSCSVAFQRQGSGAEAIELQVHSGPNGDHTDTVIRSTEVSLKNNESGFIDVMSGGPLLQDSASSEPAVASSAEVVFKPAAGDKLTISRQVTSSSSSSIKYEIKPNNTLTPTYVYMQRIKTSPSP